ncbi:phospholipid/cholesterol/gamma-HCH transport system substrate-binding protein [Reichenbachiella faecimaris]|uniref:Phospholipid/cholesterol/gamma-HCH transport system substrate-binding protein n=1 Tax=Reichenbachiella faecimaris TaxID=692418 RepID=A0A1W2G6V6_REIFA|nr:MlaD family protein [Reichenbachiella faecimaris]SMD32172.1 phospholipid/cholesterol/gamma-HCH transport system substrate-binding protein [Reichenbachiella faecimaris]
MSKEVKVGLFAIISGAILYLGFNYLKGIDFFSPTNKYYVLYKNIDGLNVSNPVIVNGYAVGRVSSIGILQKRDNKIIVELDVDEKVILGDTTVAQLTNSDFLGSKAILLQIGDLSKPLKSGDTLKSDIDKGIAALFESAEPITSNLTVTIRRINEILLGMEGAGEDIKLVLNSLNTTLRGVNQFVRQNNANLKQTLTGVNTLLANVNDKVDMLEPVLANADSTLDMVQGLPLDSAINALNGTLAQLTLMMEDINSGKGTVGKILKEDSLYNNLNKTIEDLDQLIIHFDNNPKHFLGPLGKSQKKIEKERAKAAQQ